MVLRISDYLFPLSLKGEEEEILGRGFAPPLSHFTFAVERNRIKVEV